MDGSVVIPSRLPQRSTRLSERAGPDPSFLEGVSASFQTAKADLVGAEDQAVIESYGPLVEALVDQGKSVTRYVSPSRSAHPVNADAVWADIAAARAANPKLFGEIGADRQSFEQDTLKRYREQVLQASATSSRAGLGANLIGGLGAGLLDPINLGIMVATGGGGAVRTIAQAALREAAINGATELVEQPLIAIERAKGGRTLTLGEAATNVAAGTILGGAFGAGGKAIELRGPAAVQAARGRVADLRESAIAGAWDRLPQAVRDRWANAASITDDDLPDLAEAIVGRDNMTADERAAADVVRREAAVARENPFVPNGAGVAAHGEAMADAMARVLSNIPPTQPRARALPIRPRLDGSTAIASGTVTDLPARATVKNRIAVVESGDGAHYANPLSTARGKYQFLKGTWLHYYKARFGTGGLSDADILAKRADAGVQDALMDDLTASNAAFLRRQGEAETAGNLYLTHFAGQGGARKLFDADPVARAADVLGAGVVRANPWMRDMSVSDVVRWAHDRMGEARPARAGARVELAAGEAPYREALQADIDRLQAERMRDAEPAVPAADAMSGAIDVSPQPIVRGEAPSPVFVEADDSLPVVVRAEPAAVVEDRPTVPDAVPTRAAPQRATSEVRKVIADLSDEERYDLLTVVARAGGLVDDEGHDLRGRGRLVSGAVSGRKRRAGGGGGNLPQFAPGGGHIFSKKNGRSVDGIGEVLWELGWFPERPTERQVLDLLDEASTAPGKRLYHPNARARVAAAQRFDDYEDFVQQEMLEVAPQLDRYLEPDELAPDERTAILDDMVRNGVGAEDALVAHFERSRGDVLADALDEDPDLDLDIPFDLDDPRGVAYDATRDPFAYLDEADDAGTPPNASDPGRADRAGAGESQGVGRDEGAVAEAAGPARAGDATSLEPVAHDTARAFDDPDALAARTQADSLDHDLRAATVDPAIPERQRQEAALKAASPMRAAADQDSTIGAPLFDAADQTRLQLDEEGDGVTLAQLFDDLDAEQSAIDTVRKCL